MHYNQLFLLLLFVAKVVQTGRQKRVYANDVFITIIILYLLIQQYRKLTEYHQGATDNSIDVTAWTNLHAILRELYNNDTLTIPGNVHIKGDLLVGTYKNSNGNDKSWEDSIEHACVWKPKTNKNGAWTNDTGYGWMDDTTKTANFRNKCKPVKGGGIFSFRAGHIDTHTVFMSRKQSRINGTVKLSDEANTTSITDYRKWNPIQTIRADDIHFVNAHEYFIGANEFTKHNLTNIEDTNTWNMRVRNLYAHQGQGWIDISTNVGIHGGKKLHLVQHNGQGGDLEVEGQFIN